MRNRCWKAYRRNKPPVTRNRDVLPKGGALSATSSDRRIDRSMTENRKIRNRILIADDDPLSRRMLEAFLAKSGYRVVTAADGVDALKILSAEDSPSLAILDWMMPGLEGPQVCERVRALPERPYVYILLLTARSDKQDLLNGLQLRGGRLSHQTL